MSAPDRDAPEDEANLPPRAARVNGSRKLHVFWQRKTAHFGRGIPGRTEGAERLESRRNVPSSSGAGGHLAAPSRLCSETARSQS